MSRPTVAGLPDWSQTGRSHRPHREAYQATHTHWTGGDSLGTVILVCVVALFLGCLHCARRSIGNDAWRMRGEYHEGGVPSHPTIADLSVCRGLLPRDSSAGDTQETARALERFRVEKARNHITKWGAMRPSLISV
jgi:hypothetical protein